MIKASFYCITMSLFVLSLSAKVHAVDTVLIVGYCPYGATCIKGAADIETYMTAYWRTISVPVSATPSVPTPIDAEKKKIEEDCKNKEAEILKADAVATQCKANARTTFSEESQKCSPVTEATLNVGGQFGFNGDISGLLRALNIKAGAVVNVNASGTLKWNPNADCRMKLEDTRVSTAEQCDATASNRKAELAACPKS